MCTYSTRFLCGAYTFLTLMGLLRCDDEVGMTLDELVETMTPFGQNCDQEPEHDHIIELIKNIEDAQMGTKCFRHCILQQFELMLEGKYQLEEDKVVDMLSMFYPEKEEKTRQIIISCNQEHKAYTEKCEAAHAISMCMLREMRSSEYKIPEITR